MGYEQMTRPVQRVDGLVITEAGDDVLIYDQNTYSLHTLNKQSYQVWQHCDGTVTVESIAAVTGMSVDVVKHALTQLEQASLLDAPLDETLRSNESRRSFMKKAGAAAAIPALISVSVPLAQAAASHGYPHGWPMTTNQTAQCNPKANPTAGHDYCSDDSPCPGLACPPPYAGYGAGSNTFTGCISFYETTPAFTAQGINCTYNLLACGQPGALPC